MISVNDKILKEEFNIENIAIQILLLLEALEELRAPVNKTQISKRF